MRSFFREQSIGAKLTFIIVTVSFVALATYFAIATTIDRRNSRLVLVDQTMTLARLAAEYTVGDLAFQYQLEAQADLDKLFLLPDIEEAQIYDSDGKLFVSRTKPGFQPPPCPESIGPVKECIVRYPQGRLEVFQPMSFRGKQHGTLRLVASTASFQSILDTRVTLLAAFSGIILVLVWFMAMGFQRWISRPILGLIAKVREIAGGDLSIRVEVPGSGGEIASLCRNVNLMADSLENRVREVEQSRKLLQFVSDNIPACVFWKDRNLVYVWVNRLFAETAGVGTPENVVGKTDLELPWKREEADFYRECDRKVMESDTPEFNIIEPFHQPDGTLVWLDTSKVPLHDEQGRVIGVLGSYIDVTRRKMAEEALQEAADRYEALIGASNTGAWEFHGDSGFLWCSREYFSMLGRDIRDFDMTGARNLEAAWIDLLHPDDRERAVRNFTGYLSNPEGMHQQNFRLLHRDGHWVWIWSRGKTLRDPAGRPTDITVGTHIDITERVILEERLRQSEKMEAIGQLAGGIAHDFNNQLAGILGSAELILKKLADPHLRGLTENILKASLRAAELTRKLLAFARKGKFVTIQVNVHQLIDEVVVLLQHSIDRRINVVRHLEADPPTITGDPTQLQSALLNLAINARDAMPDGGDLTFATARVELEAKTTPSELPPGHYIQVSITDTGTGMTKEVQSHLFEPFFTTKEAGKGTGLGLAAVYGAVKSHGGSVRCESEPGRGTTFRLLLPLTAVSPAVLAAEKSLSSTPGHERILLVEDEEVVRNATRDMLQALGYQVTACRDGEDAVAWFRSSWKQVDLVLLDMIMPRMDGPEAFQSMRAINPEVKVILASGFSLEGRANQLLQEGVRGFLQKPFQLEELSGKVRDVLSEENRGRRVFSKVSGD